MSSNDYFKPAHEWKHEKLTELVPGKGQVISECICGVKIVADVKRIPYLAATKIVRTYVEGGSTLVCPYTGRDHTV